jgi:HEAT repeat protein
VTRIEAEREAFCAAGDREAYLRANSHLPGPRSNLELLAGAADEVDRDWALRWAAAPVGTDPTDVFLISVGLVAQGRFAAQGEASSLPLLKRRAEDTEWRIREAVAIALQCLGDANLERLSEVVRDWSRGSPLVQRAAVAAAAEPRLLRDGRLVPAALEVLDAATTSVAGASYPQAPEVRVLRQALGYAWSVVVAADVDRGWPRFAALAASPDSDTAWIVRENLSKNRLRRLELPALPNGALGTARLQRA